MGNILDEIKLAIHSVWKRRWLALLIAWGVCLAGWVFVSMIPNRYVSEARIFVQMQSLLPNQPMNPIDRDAELQKIERTFASVVNLEKVVKRTSIGKNLNSPKEVRSAATALKERIKINKEKENLFQITAESKRADLNDQQNAELARDVVQQLINVFIEENMTGSKEGTKQSLAFLDQQIAEREKAMKAAETARVTYETQHLGQLPGVGSNAMSQDSARMELNQVESNLIGAQSSLAAARAQMASTPAMITIPGIPVSGGGVQTARVAALEQQIADAYARGWTDSYPDMAGLKTQLAAAQAAAARESGTRMVGGSSTPNPAYSQLQSMLAEKQANVQALSARRAQLAGQIAQYNAGRASQPGLVAEWDRLNREYESMKQQYDKLLQAREEARVSGDATKALNPLKFNVSDPPSLPSSPAAPGRPLLLTGVLLFGLGLGAAVALLLGQLQTGFATAKKLATASGMPVIGAISEVMTPKQKAAGAKKQKVFLGGAGALAGLFLLLLVVDFALRSGLTLR